MRRLLFALALLVLVTLATASAQAEVRTLDPVSDPLGACTSDMTVDQCMGMGTTYTRCTNSYGCPQCGLNVTLTSAVCYVIQYNFGFCTCTPKGVTRNS